jgi:hypothetical protein
MPFTLFLDKDGKPQFDANNTPLFMQEGAKDPTPINVNDLHDQVRRVGGEAAMHRKEKEALAEKLKAFDGLDAEAARKALETVRSLGDGQLLEVGKVDEIRKKAVEEHARKIESLNKALEEAKADGEKAVQAKDAMIHDLLVKGAFLNSAYLRDHTVLPPEFAYDSLGKSFSVEYVDGNPVVVAKAGSAGERLFSTANPGQYASPEEAIKHIIEHHPQRDSLLKAPAPNGGAGSRPGDRTSGAGRLSPEVAGTLGQSDFVKARKEGRL